MKWYLASAVILAAILINFVYLRADTSRKNTVSIAEMVHNPYNAAMIDSAAKLVQSGDIIVRTGNDMTSYMFCKANLRDKTYSHCGIVTIEDGKPYVYHSIGGEDNPDEVLRKDPIQFWLSPAHNSGFGILRPEMTAAQRDTLLAVAQYYFRSHTKFDLKFDITDDSKLYCAELVYRAMNKAMGDSAFIKPTKAMGYTYVAVDNVTAVPDAKWICKMAYK